MNGPAQGPARRPRIMVIAPAYPSAGSIAGIYVADQVAALQPTCDVTVVAPQARGWRLALRQAVVPVRADRSTVDDGVLRPVARTWIPRSPRSVVDGFVRAVDEAFQRAAQNSRPDLIHAHVLNPTGYAGVVVGRRHGVPTVVTEHSGPFEAILGSGFERRVAAWTIDHADRVLAVGPGLRDELLRFAPGSRIDILENVVDTNFFRPAYPHVPRPEGPLRVFSLGIQAPQKGVEILLRAVGTLSAQGVAVDLVIGGDGPERPWLEGEAQRLGVRAITRFVGILSRTEVRQWLWWCDLLVSASRHESFGLAIAEALACERPVVATRSGGPDEFVHPDSGVLVECDNPDALAFAIRGVAERRIVLDRPAGRRQIEASFGPGAFRSKIMRVYGQLIGISDDAPETG